MTPAIERWGDQTGNAIGNAADTAEAAMILRELARAFGDEYLALMSVVRRDEVGPAERLGSVAEVLDAIEPSAYRASAG